VNVWTVTRKANRWVAARVHTSADRSTADGGMRIRQLLNSVLIELNVSIASDGRSVESVVLIIVTEHHNASPTAAITALVALYDRAVESVVGRVVLNADAVEGARAVPHLTVRLLKVL